MMNLPVVPEVVELQNRLGRIVPVELSCFVFRKRYCVILHASAAVPARQLSKSAEHIAHQVVCRLNVPAELVDFFQFQPGEEPEWLRWSFQWVGVSPLKGRCLDVNTNFQQSYLEPLFSRGRVFSLQHDRVPEVA